MASFEPEYLEFIQDKIPIMKDQKLQQLILKYCEEYRIKKSQFKFLNIKDSTLFEIKTRLNQLKEHTEYLINNTMNNAMNTNNKNNRQIIIKENKVIKVSDITAKALIEGLIHCTLLYYSLSNNLNSIPNANLYLSSNSTNTKILHRMNRIKVSYFKDYIKLIYTSEYDTNTKNQIFFNVLRTIAKELNKLQDICGFIHGDLHDANLFIIFNENNLLDTTALQVKFIDFGYSIVRLPVINSMFNYILSSVVDVNLNRSIMDMTIYGNEYLRAIDLFHLFDSFDSINPNNRNVYFDGINEFINFIHKFISLWQATKYNRFTHNSSHKYTRSFNFEPIALNSLLIPSNFLKINYIINSNGNGNLVAPPEYIKNKKVSSNRDSLNPKKKRPTNQSAYISTPPQKIGKSLFNNNNNNNFARRFT